MNKKIKPLGIMMLITFTLIVSCKSGGGGIPTETPPEDTCGVGSGSYYFSVETSPPDNFDCNSAGSFPIVIQPYIDPSYSGYGVFNRLYFELEKDWKIYRSNYVEFYSGNYDTMQLEWGGSLPTGDYTVTGIMKNIQLNSKCKDSVFVEYTSWLGDIAITQFSNPAKVMNIEYFCQDSDTGIIDRYDVFLSPNTGEYMDIAFNIANTRDGVITYQTDLPCSLIVLDDEAIVRFISSLKQSRDKMFLCGIKGFRDDQGNFLDHLGITALSDTINFTPSDSSGSLIAIKACINYAATEYKVDFNDLVTSTVVHELGHQRAILHHVGHSRFCRMNEHPISPGDRSTYLNPHFCNSCITKIKNVSW